MNSQFLINWLLHQLPLFSLCFIYYCLMISGVCIWQEPKVQGRKIHSWEVHITIRGGCINLFQCFETGFYGWAGLRCLALMETTIQWVKKFRLLEVMLMMHDWLFGLDIVSSLTVHSLLHMRMSKPANCILNLASLMFTDPFHKYR